MIIEPPLQKNPFRNSFNLTFNRKQMVRYYDICVIVFFFNGDFQMEHVNE